MTHLDVVLLIVGYILVWCAGYKCADIAHRIYMHRLAAQFEFDMIKAATTAEAGPLDEARFRAVLGMIEKLDRQRIPP